MKRLFTLLFSLSAVLPSVVASDVADYNSFNKFRFGGYGEMVANFKNYGLSRYTGIQDTHRATIAIPRFVLALDYKFTSKWILGAEIEMEAGGVGVETEIEAGENQFEYEVEMEKGGEVALEQFHITRLITEGFNIKAGHMIVPVGLTNSHHEPILFFGPERPEGETTILPSTWHETGVSIFGSFGRKKARFNYQAMAVAGLNPDNFGRDHWVKDGKQGLFEVDNFSSPGYVARMDYVGVTGLRVGGSAYYCAKTSKNADKPYNYAQYDNTGLYILNGDIQYINRFVTLRGNVIWGHIANANGITKVHYGTNSPYHTGKFRSVAETALTYGAEVGYNLKSCIKAPKCPTIYPYMRYEYFNSQEKCEGIVPEEPRCQVSKWQAGVNYYILPNLVAKLAYSNRRIGTRAVFGYDGAYHRENEFSVGLAYTGWFIKK